MSSYPKTVHQMRDFLLHKGYEPAVVEETIERLVVGEFLDDRKYTTLMLQSEVCRKWKPIYVVEQKLRLRGVDRRLIDEEKESMSTEIQEWMRTKIEQLHNRYIERWYDIWKTVQSITAKWYAYDLVKSVCGV